MHDVRCLHGVLLIIVSSRVLPLWFPKKTVRLLIRYYGIPTVMITNFLSRNVKKMVVRRGGDDL